MFSGMKFRNAFLILALTAAQAHAAPAPPREYCGNLGKIVEYVDRCSRNHVIADMAIGCYQKLQKGSADLAASLEKKFSTNGSGTTTSLNSSAANLKLAQDALKGLENKNDVAIVDMLDYFLNLVHPEAAGEPVSGKSTDDVLKRSPCFADNRKTLLQALALMELNKEGLRRAREGLENLSGRHSEEIQSMLQAMLQPLQASKASAKKAPPPNFERKKHQNRQSDITQKKEK